MLVHSMFTLLTSIVPLFAAVSMQRLFADPSPSITDDPKDSSELTLTQPVTNPPASPNRRSNSGGGGAGAGVALTAVPTAVVESKQAETTTAKKKKKEKGAAVPVRRSCRLMGGYSGGSELIERPKNEVAAQTAK